jgi:hypothetical protein
MKLVEVGKLETLEKISAVTRCRLLERIDGCLLQVAIGKRAKFQNVDGHIPRIDLDVGAVGNDPQPICIVQQPPQLGKAPAQGAARIVGHFPQKIAELFATKAASVQAEIRKQSAGLSGWRQYHCLAIADDREFSEKSELKPAHGLSLAALQTSL